MNSQGNPVIKSLDNASSTIAISYKLIINLENISMFTANPSLFMPSTLTLVLEPINNFTFIYMSYSSTLNFIIVRQTTPLGIL